MKKLSILVLLLSSCAASAPRSNEDRSPSSIGALLYHCTGMTVLGSGVQSTSYDVKLVRDAMDQRRGTPVELTVSRKVDSNTARPAEWQVLVDESVLLEGYVRRDLHLEFTGGKITAEPGNSGISGISPALQGTLTLDKFGDIPVRCPLDQDEK